MSKREEAITFNFIRDEPAKQDSFGSHARVASAIASVIRSQQEFKVIGLLGPWGAGKSTVVKLTEAQLKSYTDIDTHLFYYDAWLHQNDPPRRSFLETLIHFLADRKLTVLTDWQVQLDQLNRQIEDTDITSTPTLTTSGRIIAFSLLTWPLALPFVGHEAYDAAFGPTATPLDFWAFVLGSTALLLPFLIALGFYISWRPTIRPFDPKFRTWDNWFKHKKPHENESILSLVMNKEVQRQRNRVIRTPDPTTIEFQRIFREIIATVSAQNRRFIFVIDNLDRLPENDALALWGTIRSFFLGAQESKHVKTVGRLPTVILPIDENAVERMYSVQHNEEAPDLAKSFMDKTFDLTFRVARPVLSNWSAYLKKQMSTVFGPDMPKDWPYLTSRLYERFFISERDPNVTPRTINTLINDIAVLLLQWRDLEISFVSIVYYAIWQRHIDADILHAVATPFAPGIADLDPNWREAIAALHYGAPPAEAAQILIDQPLRKALADRDTKSFAELALMPSFDRMLQRQIDQFAATDGIDLEPVMNTAFLLDTISGEGELWFGHAWRSLRTALLRTGVWRVLGQNEIDSLKSFIGQCPEIALSAFLQMLDGKLNGLVETAANDPKTTRHFIDIWRAAKAAAEKVSIALPAIHVPGSADSFLRVAASCRDDSELLSRLTTSVDEGEIVQSLGNALSDQTRALGAEGMFLALLALRKNWPIAPVVDVAFSVVRDQHANHPGVTAGLLILGLLRPSDNNAKNHIGTLVQGGALLNRLNEAYSVSNDIAAARATALLLLTNPNASLPDNGNWAPRFGKSPKFIEMIDAALRQFDNAENWQQLILSTSSYPVWTPILRAVTSTRVRENTLGSSIRAEPIITHIQQYLDYVDEPLRPDFMAQVARANKFWEEFKQQPFEATAVLTILRLLLRGKGEGSASALAFSLERLENVTEGQWTSALLGNTEPLLFAREVAELRQLQLGNQLYDALHALVPKLLTDPDASLRERWFEAARHLRVHARQTLFKAVRDRLHSGDPVSNLAGLLEAGGDSFLQIAAVGEEADAAVRHIVFRLLEASTGVSWLEEHSKIVNGWIRASDVATRAFLGERICERSKSSDPQMQERLESLRNAWSLVVTTEGSAAISDTA